MKHQILAFTLLASAAHAAAPASNDAEKKAKIYERNYQSVLGERSSLTNYRLLECFRGLQDYLLSLEKLRPSISPKTEKNKALDWLMEQPGFSSKYRSTWCEALLMLPPWYEDFPSPHTARPYCEEKARACIKELLEQLKSKPKQEEIAKEKEISGFIDQLTAKKPL